MTTVLERSPVAGLARRTLGAPQVLAQAVAAAAPGAGTALTPALVVAAAGGGALLATVLACVLAVLVGASLADFTRRIAAAGGPYTFVARAAGPRAARAAGAGLLLGYGAVAAVGVTGTGLYGAQLLTSTGAAAGAWVLPALMALGGAVATGLVAAGVRASATATLVVEAAAVVLVVVLFAVLAQLPGPGWGAVLRPGAGDGSGTGGLLGGVGGVCAGVAVGFAMFVGFESASALGVEARRPLRVVTAVSRWTPVGLGVLLLVATAVQLRGAELLADGLAGTSTPVVDLAAAAGQPWLARVLDAALAASFLACATASGTALCRVLFTMGREGVLPRWLGATHPRSGVPHRAVAAVMPAVVTAPLVAVLLGAAPSALIASLTVVAAAGQLLAYALLCAGAPRFLAAIGESTRGAALRGRVTAGALLVVLVAYVAWGSGHGWGRELLVTGAAVALALGHQEVVRRRDPARWTGAGVYDEPVVADFLHAAHARATTARATTGRATTLATPAGRGAGRRARW